MVSSRSRSGERRSTLTGGNARANKAGASNHPGPRHSSCDVALDLDGRLPAHIPATGVVRPPGTGSRRGEPACRQFRCPRGPACRQRLHRRVRGHGHHLGRPTRVREGRLAGAAARGRALAQEAWSSRSCRGHTGPSTRWASTRWTAGACWSSRWSPAGCRAAVDPGEVDASHRALPRDGRGRTPCLVGDAELGRALLDRRRHPRGRPDAADGSFVGGDELPAWLPDTRDGSGSSCSARRAGSTATPCVTATCGRTTSWSTSPPMYRPRHRRRLELGRSRRTPWVDWVGLLPLMAAQGIDTTRSPVRRRSPATPTPSRWTPTVATIAAYMLGGYREEPPPGCTPACGSTSC